MPERLAAMLDMAGRVSIDTTLTDGPPLAALRRPSQSARGGAIARIEVYGVIEQRSDFWSDMFGGVGLDRVRAEFHAALVDPDVKGILLDIDSPGGVVAGTPELAREIRAARGQKPILAVANTVAASAAYYLGAQADEFSVTPSGQVGSIGVVYLHTDLTGMAEKQGVSFRLFRSQPRKADANPYESLSEEAAADIQSKVDSYDAMFVADVAAGRGVSEDRVRSGYGQGRMFLATEALAAGLVDRVETIGAGMARLASGGVGIRTAPSPVRAQIQGSTGRMDAADSTHPDEPDAETKSRGERLWEIALAGR